MAQALFEALAAGVASIDSQTASAVQSLLDSQNVSEVSQAPSTTEDEDVFQCGKCKLQFSTLTDFLTHKQIGQCVGMDRKIQPSKSEASNTSLGSTNTAHLFPPVSSIQFQQHDQQPQVAQQQTHQHVVQGQQQHLTYSTVPASSLTQTLGPGMVLNTDDLMTLTSLDQASLQAATLQPSTSIQNSQFLSQVGAPIAIRPSTLSTSGSSTTSTTPSTSLPSVASAYTATSLQSALSSGTIFIQPLTQYVQAQLGGPPLVVTSSVGQQGSDKINLTIPLTKPSPTKAGRKTTAQMSQQFQQLQPIQQQVIQHQPQTVQMQQGQLSQIAPGQQATIVTVVDLETGMLKQRKAIPKTLQTAQVLGTSSLVAAGGLLEENKKKLTCQYCDKSFTKNFDLQQHIRSHTGEKPFQCIVCGRAFAQKSNVKKHMQTHKVWPTGLGDTLPKQPIVVTEDGQNGTAEVTVHVDKTDESTMRSAMELNISGPSKDNPNSQVNVMIDNSYLCQYCPEKFKTYFQLKTHMTLHKAEQVYKCILKSCLATFSELDAFVEHTKLHEDEMSYRCHLCSKQFPSLYDLGVHQYTHSLYPNQGPKPTPKDYRCSKCNSKYSTPEALEHHQATSTHNYPCSHCEKIFTCERYLRRHLPVHGSVGEYQCTSCEKRFKTEHYLKMHYLIHTGEKPFSCQICDSKFNRKDKLKRHMLIHDPVKKYKCPFKSHTGCTKEFNRPDKLKAHIISHSGLRPYKCKECGKSFSRRPHYLEHERSHRDDYRYRCIQCNRGFHREKFLNEHKCYPNKTEGKIAGLKVEPHWSRTRIKRKGGRPKKRMITVTEDTPSDALRKNPVRGRRGRRRWLTNAARAQQMVDEENAVKVQQPGKDEAEERQGVTNLEAAGGDSRDIHQAPETEYQLVAGGDANAVTVTPINVSSLPTNQYQTTTIPVRTSTGEMAKEICVQIHPLHGHIIHGQGYEEGTEAQVITIDPSAFSGETVNIDHSQIITNQGQYEGHVDGSQGGDLGTATIIATGPNMATFVVNTSSGEILATDASGTMVPGASHTVSYVTQEQFESLQANAGENGTLFASSDTLIQSSNDMLRSQNQ